MADDNNPCDYRLDGAHAAAGGRMIMLTAQNNLFVFTRSRMQIGQRSHWLSVRHDATQ